MSHSEIRSRLTLLVALLLKSRDRIVDAHADATRMPRSSSLWDFNEGIAAIENGITHLTGTAADEDAPLGTVGIIAPANAPFFAFAYATGLLAYGYLIQVHFPDHLGSGANSFVGILASIVSGAGLEKQISFAQEVHQELIVRVLNETDRL